MKKYKYFYISKIYYIFFIKQFFIKFEILYNININCYIFSFICNKFKNN